MSEENVIPEPELKTYTQEEVNNLIEESTTGLKSKVDELLGETKEAKRLAKEREQAEQEALDNAARKSGDLETIDKSWEAKFNTRESELNEQIAQRDKLLLGSKTQSSLTDLSADFRNPETIPSPSVFSNPRGAPTENTRSPTSSSANDFMPGTGLS